MPKLKTHRAAAKRYRITVNGKVMRRKAYHSHILTHKSPKRKRNLRQIAVASETDLHRLKKEIPYAQYIR